MQSANRHVYAASRLCFCCERRFRRLSPSTICPRLAIVMSRQPRNLWEIGTLPITTLTWGQIRAGQPHKCSTCGVILLESGQAFAADPVFNGFLHDPKISKLSRKLNLILSFASLESTHPFPQQTNGPPGFMAIGGRVYHRVQPSHENSSVRWLLYDGFEDVDAPHHGSQWFNDIPTAWIDALRTALLRLNSFAITLRTLGQLRSSGVQNARLILEDKGTAEIAAIMSYSNTTQEEIKARRLIVVTVDGENQSVSTLSRFWEPLSYPLLFPHGTLGWGMQDATNAGSFDVTPDADIPTTQMWHYRARLLREDRFQIFGRLANEYMVDMFSRDLESRLAYIRTNQRRLRQNDAVLMGSSDVEAAENIYLPASFLGSWRWASEQVSDSLAIAAAYGPPTFFITMTCAPDWPEIASRLRAGQTFADIPLVVVRVFKRKLSLLLLALKTMFPNVGCPIYCIYSIEFQKRGLPHAHILIKYPKGCLEPAEIDSIISAEIPEDPEDASLVRKYMLHSHPNGQPTAYCQRKAADGTFFCRFHYPHPVQATTTIDSEGRVHYRRRRACDSMVVAYFLPLLRELRCHLNFEAANTSHMFQYIFKYIHKPGCSTRYKVVQPDGGAVDEIQDFWDARYLSAGEAAWRIMGYHVAQKDPAVTALPIHLPDSAVHHQYARSGTTSTLSLLDRYFLRPTGSFQLENAETMRPFDELTYAEYFTSFRLAQFDPSKVGRPGFFLDQLHHSGSPQKHVILRNSAKPHLSCIHSVRPSQGELFYLRAILQTQPCRSFLEARTVSNVLHSTYQDAANALGLFANTNEAMYAVLEGVRALRTPRQLRILFIHLLVNECVPSPATLWDTFQTDLSRDFTLRHGNSEELGLNFALDELSRLLEEYGKSLSDFGLPEATMHTAEVVHELERWSPIVAQLDQHADNMVAIFKPEQCQIYTQILSAIERHQPLTAFVDGKVGRGKTAMVTALCDKLRSRGEIVIATATSAFAAQLYPGGRTTHSALKVPVDNKNELLQSTIKPDSSRAELIRKSSLLIWDEAPMANRAVLACVDAVLREIMGNNLDFGGKVMVLLGDFRQTCPVVRRGSRAQVVDASIKSSPLWPRFKIMRLTQPIRNAEDLEFAAFVDAIGDGAGPEVSLDILDQSHSAEELLDFVYPAEVLGDPSACIGRAILAPTNMQVDTYNNAVLHQIEGISSVYFAADTFRESDELGVLPPASVLDYVVRHTPHGLPPHSLTIRTNAVYRLLRNFSIDRGLVKNTRAVVTNVGHRLITVRVLRAMGSISDQDLDDVGTNTPECSGPVTHVT